jgi:Mrp family chromosome partitioning ATPase
VSAPDSTLVDLSSEMAELWASLALPTGRGVAIQLIAARRGEGVSTVARELARYGAEAGRTVWLVDADVAASPQHAHIRLGASRFGELGPPVAATPDGSTFVSVRPLATTATGAPWPDAAYVAAHRVGRARWWVTRFRRETLRPGQKVRILPRREYWDAMRRHADLVVVDCPSADRSEAATILAPFMDQTLLVVAADQGELSAPARLRDAIAETGGAVSGLFFNRGAARPPAFLRGVLG